MTEMPYDERRLQLVREADGEDARTYCPPLDAPMSVQQRYAAMTVDEVDDYHRRTAQSMREMQRLMLPDSSLHGITDENAPRVLRAIFRDDAERKDFGAALAVWACVIGSGILLAYILHWAWTALTGGV